MMWLDGITDSMDMGLGGLQELVIENRVITVPFRACLDHTHLFTEHIFLGDTYIYWASLVA